MKAAMRRCIAVLLLVLTSFFAVPASAQFDGATTGTEGSVYSEPAPKVNTTPTVTSGEAIGMLYEGFMKPIKAFGESQRGTGASMVLWLCVLHVMIGGVMYAGGTLDPFDMVVKGISLSLFGSLIYSAIVPSEWMGYITGLGGRVTLPEAISSGFQSLLGAAGSTGSSTSRIANLCDTLFNALFDNLTAKVINPEWGTFDILKNIVGVIFGLLFWAGSMILFVVAAAVILGEAIAADLTINIALAFTGLMVPWALFPPMRFLFDAWLKTFLVGNIGLLIATLFASGMSGFAKVVSKIGASTGSGDGLTAGGTLIALYGPVLVGSIILIVVAGKITQIAGGLLMGGGMSGLSLKEFARSIGASSMASSAPLQGTKELAGRSQSAASAMSQAGSWAAGRAKQMGSAIGLAAKGDSSGAMGQFNGPPPGLASSPAGKATAAIAANKGKDPKSPEAVSAAIHGNQVFRQSLRDGAGRPAAYAAMNRAISSNLESSSKVAKPEVQQQQTPAASPITAAAKARASMAKNKRSAP